MRRSTLTWRGSLTVSPGQLIPIFGEGHKWGGGSRAARDGGALPRIRRRARTITPKESSRTGWPARGCPGRTGVAGASIGRMAEERSTGFSRARSCARGSTGRTRTAAACRRGIPRCCAAGDRRQFLASFWSRTPPLRRAPAAQGAKRELTAPHPSLDSGGYRRRRHITNMVIFVKSWNGVIRLCKGGRLWA